MIKNILAYFLTISLLSASEDEFVLKENLKGELLVRASSESFLVAQSLVTQFQAIAKNQKITLVADMDKIGYENKSQNQSDIYIGTDIGEHRADFTFTEIYTEAVVFIVNNKSNISEISREQITKMLAPSDADATLNWSDLSKDKKGDVVACGPLTVSETSRFLMKKLVGKVISGYQELEKNSEIISSVAKDDKYIGFVQLGYVPIDKVKIIGISSPETSKPSVPTLDSIPNDYLLARKGYLITREDPLPDDVTIKNEFVRFVKSKQGQMTIRGTGMIPSTNHEGANKVSKDNNPLEIEVK